MHEPLAVEHMHLLRFAGDGRAPEHRVVRDDDPGMALQAGLLPPPPS
jgi:hypothetical protein